jgi:glutathione-specific gamma-glutamylcyclotransferase
VLRREILLLPSPLPARWVNVHCDGGVIRALAFVIDRKSDRYVGGLAPEAVADALATAVGTRGSMAEYLFSTVSHLEALGPA